MQQKNEEEAKSLLHMVVCLLSSLLLSFITVKPVFFREFRDLGGIAKTTGCEYSQSHAIFGLLFSSASKTSKL